MTHIRRSMMKKTNKPYLDAPNKDNSRMKEQLIYGGGETVTEKERKKKDDKKSMLNE